MSRSNEDIDEIYKELQRQGKNTVQDLIQWLKDAQVLESIDKSEKEAEKFFKNVEDKNKVSMKQFEQAMMALEKESSIVMDDLNRMLLEENNKFMKALQNAAKAFEDTMGPKEPPPSTCLII